MGSILLVFSSTPVLARIESYLEYVHRSVARQHADEALAQMLSDAKEPFVDEATVNPLAQANIAFLDGLIASQEPSAPAPSSSALIALPLLVQLVRDWSAEGEHMRNTTYRPIIDALVPFLLGRGSSSPRILLPGSGMGRLAYSIAERLRGVRIVALDPDVHSQIAATFFLTGGDGVDSGGSGGSGGSGTEDEERGSSPRVPTIPSGIHPSLHVTTNWAHSSHRLAPVTVPDVPLEVMRRVERSSNITFAVGTLEDAGAKWLAGRDALGIDDPSNEHGAADTATGTGFDAVATCFVLDVLSDLRLSLRALHAMLRPTRGLWVSLGPLAYPEPHEGLIHSRGAERASSTGVVMTAAQQLALVRSAGFELMEHRMVDGCEYNVLPHQLERTVRSCLFFMARPAGRSSMEASASGRESKHDEL